MQPAHPHQAHHGSAETHHETAARFHDGAVERAEAPQVKQAVADRIARQRQQHDSAAHTRMRRFQQADEQKRERREHGRQRQRGRKRHRRQKRPGNGNRRRHAAPLLQHGKEQRHAHAECEKGKRVKQVEPFDNASFFESYHVPSLHRPHVPIARCAAHAHCAPSSAQKPTTRTSSTKRWNGATATSCCSRA